MKRSVLLLGATGTIGDNTLEVIRRNPDKFQLKSIVANSNAQKLSAIAREFGVENCGIYDANKAKDIDVNVNVVVGEDAILSEICAQHHDVVVSAISGFAALKPTIACIPHLEVLAIANKESIVAAGKFLKHEIMRCNKVMVPVDSEHNALFQIFDYSYSKNIERVIITASGGPFLNYTREMMRDIDPKKALVHPNWNMGAKNTLDSATLANKGLEILEAQTLFTLRSDQISALIHPQSVVHAMIEYDDGTMISNMYKPTMQIPIAHAMSYPSRLSAPHKRTDIAALNALTFQEPDLARFPLLKAAMNCLDKDQCYRIAFNAANEVAGNAFIAGKIGFLDIERIVLDTLASLKVVPLNSVQDIITFNNEICELLSLRSF